MSYETLLKKNFGLIDLDKERHSFFFHAWEEVSFKKGDFLTEAGKTEKYFYVVLEGVQAIYLLLENGEKKIIGFSYTGSFSGVYDSFLNAEASHFYLEALTPSKLIRITKEQYDQFFERYPEFNYWGRIAHQQLLIGRAKREIELISFSAKARFEAFMERCPKELLTIPQKHLASYLNMTPETFSRLRAAKS